MRSGPPSCAFGLEHAVCNTASDLNDPLKGGFRTGCLSRGTRANVAVR